MNIKEAENLSGISGQNIRYYEKQGLDQSKGIRQFLQGIWRRGYPDIKDHSYAEDAGYAY